MRRITPEQYDVNNAAAAAGTMVVRTLTAAEITAGKKVYVVGMGIFSSGTCTVTLKSDAVPTSSPTTLLGPFNLTAQTGIVFPKMSDVEDGFYWTKTVAGRSLTLVWSAEIQVSGSIVFYVA